jgi:glycogen operon protein
VGFFPPGWAEWNDRFRDVTRDFWKGSASAGEMAPRLCGSSDLFNALGRRPAASINFVTAHDGFTLHDLVSYNDKHNEANGENNEDGTSDNRSWNCGAEGPTTDAAVNTLRDRQLRNLLATLLLSQGTPMLVAGDESLRTQQGNNNAYCQDNELSWVKWDPDERARSLTEFVRKLTGLRHRYPILRRSRFLTGAYDEELGIRDLTWINANGEEMRDADWQDENMRCFGMLIDGRARPTGVPQRGIEATMLLVLNAHHDLVLFTLPASGNGTTWLRLVDTNLPDQHDEAPFTAGTQYGVTARSLLLFKLVP